METEMMRNTSFYRSHYTEEMTAAIKPEEIYVTDTALPQSLINAASLPGTIGRLSSEGLTGKVGKKRSRASRRAHTIVLNADKASFKAMVQHFTGITSANISASALPPNSDSFEDYFRPKSMPADLQQYSSARLKSLDTNNPPFASYAYAPQPSYFQNIPFVGNSSVGMRPSLSNSKAHMTNNSGRQGMADLSSASLWEEVLGMDLPVSGLYRNMY